METRMLRSATFEPPCRVSRDELANDHAQLPSFPSERDKRQQVIELADRFLAGETVRLTHWANRPYTIDDLLTEVFEHPLYDKAVFAAYSTDPAPMRDLVIRIARYAVAESLFGIGGADRLGFMK